MNRGGKFGYKSIRRFRKRPPHIPEVWFGAAELGDLKMWSWWLSKIKRVYHLPKLNKQSCFLQHIEIKIPPIFTKIDRWQHLLELIIASNVLALVLALAEAQSWHALNGSRLLQYIVFINWVILSFCLG